MNSTRDISALVGRILLALIFVIFGFTKIAGFDDLVGYIASKGMPLPQLMAVGAIVVELGGGLLLLLGYRARWAALGIFLFLIPTTLVFHNFWSVPADQVMAQRTDFFKNVAIMGGMLMVWAFGPGRYALGGDRDNA
ncbi:MAG: DoxX family protein [Casimicrobiaceae bacterium]